MGTYNTKERQERISKSKCALFNKTSDDCKSMKYEKDGNTYYKKCKKTGNSCLYKLCPKIKKRLEEKKNVKKK